MDSGCTSKGFIAHSPSPRPLSDSECTTPQFCSVDENTREATNDTLLSPTEEHEVHICLFDNERAFPSFLDSLCSSLDLLCTGQCKFLPQPPPPSQPQDYAAQILCRGRRDGNLVVLWAGITPEVDLKSADRFRVRGYSTRSGEVR